MVDSDARRAEVLGRVARIIRDKYVHILLGNSLSFGTNTFPDAILFLTQIAFEDL
jgi:hypothetical protein